MEGSITGAYAPSGPGVFVLPGLLGKVLLMGTSFSWGVVGGLTPLRQDDKGRTERSESQQDVLGAVEGKV